MGFLSKIGKGLSIAAPLVAAPFTGGLSLAALAPALAGVAGNALSGVGQVAGGAAQGAQQGRQFDTQSALTQQQLANQAAQDRERALMDRDRAGMDRAKFGVDAAGARGRQALAGSLMQGLQDVNIGRPAGSTIPTFNVQGGLRPSAMGDGGREAGGNLLRQALMAQMNGEALPEAPGAYEGAAQIPMPQAGMGEKLLGGLGLGGSLLGALGGAFNRPQAPRTPPIMSEQPNPLIFSKQPYKGLFAPQGGLA